MFSDQRLMEFFSNGTSQWGFLPWFQDKLVIPDYVTANLTDSQNLRVWSCDVTPRTIFPRISSKIRSAPMKCCTAEAKRREKAEVVSGVSIPIQDHVTFPKLFLSYLGCIRLSVTLLSIQVRAWYLHLVSVQGCNISAESDNVSTDTLKKCHQWETNSRSKTLAKRQSGNTSLTKFCPTEPAWRPFWCFGRMEHL